MKIRLLILIILNFYFSTLFSAGKIHPNELKDNTSESKEIKEHDELQSAVPDYVTPIKIDELTILQQKILKKFQEIGKLQDFDNSLLNIISSYTPEFSKEETDKLLKAIENNWCQLKDIQEMVENGACVNHPDPNFYYNSPLHNTVMIEHFNVKTLQMIQLLIHFGANVNSIFYYKFNDWEQNMTPLNQIMHRARCKYDPLDRNFDQFKMELIKTIRLFLEKGANPNIAFNKYVGSILIEATYLNIPEIIELLLEFGADPKKGTDLRGQTFEQIISTKPELLRVYKKWEKRQSEKENSKNSSSAFAKASADRSRRCIIS